ncbi:MAG TPA: heme ABC exporter ATP-binding protein CcmA [Acidimicrobiales bacterium]|nr:heme ABC exporter ATP-binding protein CcmA [Acidimicrobiales bacterium]
MAPAVHLRSVVALVGRFPVLAGVDLTVSAGEVVLLRGSNGAGKTSLLRLCAGLLPVAAGEARVLGCDLVADRREVRRRVGLLSPEGGLYDDLSVGENVRFAVRAAGLRASAGDEAMERLGLTGRLRHLSASRLSTGQRRRAALAVVIARAPELWLLDEPHAGLDESGRQLVDALMLEAVAGGATVVVASHEAGPVDGLPVRTVTVAGGRTAESAVVA